MVSERTLTAYHEAGHALVCHVAFGNVSGLSLRPDVRTLGRQSAERMTWTPGTIACLTNRVLAEERALAGVWWCLAGQAAESLLVRGYQVRADEDLEGARAYHAAGWGAREGGLELALALSWPRLRRWLRSNRLHLDLVARVLEAQEELSGEAFYAELAELPLLRPPRTW